MRKVTRKRMFAGKVAAIGVDRGGTWLRIEAVDARGRSIYSHREPSPPVAGISASLDKLWRRWKIADLPSLAVASAGVWTRQERDRLRRKLSDHARRVLVTSDVEAAYHGALDERPGIILIAGTGSIALARGMNGRGIRRGGHGPVHGDEGSAYWIGRAALDSGLRKLRSSDRRSGRSRVARVAALAGSIITAAQRGHAESAVIVHAAQEHLAALAFSAARAASLGVDPLMSWSGTLMENDFFRAGVMENLRDRGLMVRRHAPRRTTALAAALLALRESPAVAIRVNHA